MHFHCKRNIENGWKMNDTKINLICKSVRYYTGNKKRYVLARRVLIFNFQAKRRICKTSRFGGPTNEKWINKYQQPIYIKMFSFNARPKSMWHSKYKTNRGKYQENKTKQQHQTKYRTPYASNQQPAHTSVTKRKENQ